MQTPPSHLRGGINAKREGGWPFLFPKWAASSPRLQQSPSFPKQNQPTAYIRSSPSSQREDPQPSCMHPSWTIERKWELKSTKKKWLKPWQERVCKRSAGVAKEGRKEKPKPERKKKRKIMGKGGAKNLLNPFLKLLKTVRWCNRNQIFDWTSTLARGWVLKGMTRMNKW